MLASVSVIVLAKTLFEDSMSVSSQKSVFSEEKVLASPRQMMQVLPRFL